MVVSFGYALTTRRICRYKDVKSLLAFAKANPEKVTYASGGRGTGQHIAMAVASHLAGSKMTHVPYRGAQAAYQDILGGRVDLFFDNVSTALPLIDDSRVNVLAMSTPKRHPRLPDVPTLKEIGLDFAMETWFGIFAPAATPKPVLDKLRSTMAVAVAKPDFASVFTKSGGIEMKLTAAESEALVKREIGAVDQADGRCRNKAGVDQAGVVRPEYAGWVVLPKAESRIDRKRRRTPR